MPAPIDQLFDNIYKLPQIPEVVRILIYQLHDPDAEMLDIAKNVEKEQVIALKILRLVNSAHFGLARKIGSIEEATVLLGINQLKTLVIASGIVSSIPKIENFDIRTFWIDSFRTAAYARWLAQQSQLSADIAYTAGLLVNLGTLLIHMGLPKEANEIDQHAKAGHVSLSELEEKCLGYTEQDVCAELCRRWHFADELVDAIQQSADPASIDSPSAIACALHLARYFSKSVESDLNSEEMMQALPLSAAEKIGLSADFFNKRLGEMLTIESKLEGLLD
jgi:HD-like signal output (HDOD) protein